MSYDEIGIAALMSVGGPTTFLNDVCGGPLCHFRPRGFLLQGMYIRCEKNLLRSFLFIPVSCPYACTHIFCVCASSHARVLDTMVDGLQALTANTSLTVQSQSVADTRSLVRQGRRRKC